MRRHFTFQLLTGMLSLMLASCATFKEQATMEQLKIEPASWALEQEKRQSINIWEIRGRLGVQSEYNGGSMDIIWKQSEQEYAIRLLAPLGAGNYLIQGNDDFAEIRFPDGEKKIIENTDDIFADTLEVALPVTAIKNWIRGLPAKSLSIEKISWNEQGLLHKIKQSGWNVEMTNYIGNEIPLPHAIYVNRDDNPALDIRLLLRQWMIDN